MVEKARRAKRVIKRHITILYKKAGRELPAYCLKRKHDFNPKFFPTKMKLAKKTLFIKDNPVECAIDNIGVFSSSSGGWWFLL